jgi:uncharacterized protein (TIGR03086 family)
MTPETAVTDVRALYRRAQDTFGRHVHGVGDGQWTAATPCADWDVRTLVNHVLGEVRWAVPLFEGATVAEVGGRFDGDLLGDDPVARWDAAAREALAAMDDEGAMDRIVHLSFGDFQGRVYSMQLFADLLIHGWDLSVATGQDPRLDPELVTACAAWFAGVADGYRQAGAVGARPHLADDADPQARLLAEFGRSAPDN